MLYNKIPLIEDVQGKIVIVSHFWNRLSYTYTRYGKML